MDSSKLQTVRPKADVDSVSPDEVEQLITLATSMAEDADRAERRFGTYQIVVSVYVCAAFSLGVSLDLSIWIPSTAQDFIYLGVSTIPLLTLVHLGRIAARIARMERASLSEVVRLADEVLEHAEDRISPVARAIFRARLARIRMSGVSFGPLPRARSLQSRRHE